MDSQVYLQGKIPNDPKVIREIMAKQIPDRVTEEYFIHRAVVYLANFRKDKRTGEVSKTEKYLGIQCVNSGLNQGFRDQFNKESSECTDKMVKAGLLEMRPSRGAPTFYLPGEGPSRATDALTTMGLKKKQ